MHLNDDPKSNDDAKFQIITLHLILNPTDVRTYVRTSIVIYIVIVLSHMAHVHPEVHTSIHASTIG